MSRSHARSDAATPANVVDVRGRAFTNQPTPPTRDEPQADYAALGEMTGELHKTLAIMKRARFNAARRLRKKHDAGQFAFALSGIYGFLVPLFTLQFSTVLSPFTASLVSFVAATAGALSFVVALHYQNQDFDRRAERLHACGLDLNALRQHLKGTVIATPEHLRWFTDRYDAILRNSENHDHIDYLLAMVPTASRTGTNGWRLKFGLFLRTYGVCAFVLVAPPMIGILIWLALHPAG